MRKEALRIVFAGGGTGGHLFPALAVAEELRARHPDAEILFVGAVRVLVATVVPLAGFALRALPLAGIRGRSLPAKAGAVVRAAIGVARCAGWMARERPSLVVGTGAYASGPAVLAARLLGVPTMVMEQNHFPGATNRFLARHVDAVCLPSEEARRRLAGVGIVTGNPVRREFTRIGPAPGRDTLSLLVFGGSRGARSINRAVTAALPALRRIGPAPFLVHQTGYEDAEWVAAAYSRYEPGRYEVLPFIEDMPARLAAADLVVCRAGATTLAELAAAGRPAILVPYPHAAGDHQTRNAEAVERAGAAVLLADRDLDPARLAAIVEELARDPARRRRMAAAARALSIPDAASRIADVADSLLGGRRSAGGGRVP